jgi:Flp pilus assembly protein TadD
MPFSRHATVASLAVVALLSACDRKAPATPAGQPAGASELGVLLTAGLNAFEQGGVKDALVHFQKAAALRPMQYEVQLDLANALLRGDQPEPALAAAQAALHLNKDSAAAYYITGCCQTRLGKAAEAVAAFQQSLKLDPNVSATHFQLGQAHLALSQNAEAEAAFRRTAQVEPEHRAVYYALSQVLRRLGRSDDAAQMLTKHQEVNAGQIAGITNATFFEKCAHTAIILPAVEAEQPAAQGVAVKFVDATAEVFGGKTFGGPAGIVDPAHTGANGMFALDESGVRLLVNTAGRLASVGEPIAAVEGAIYGDCLVGDLNNDGFEDAMLLSDKGVQVLLLGKEGAMRDGSRSARLGPLALKAGVLVDLDFTGKLGVAAITGDGTVKILRNEGPARFADITTKHPQLAALTGAGDVTMDDWDGDDRPDLIVARPGNGPWLHGNKPRAAESGPAAPKHWPSASVIAAADFDGDLHTDLLAATGEGIVVFHGGGERRTKVSEAGQVTSFAVLDYDNDGWLDVLACGEKGVRAWRNAGASFRETDLGLPTAATRRVKAADFDNDGDSDLVAELASGELRILRNDGGSANPRLTFRLPGKRSNASGIGARIELIAGGWRSIRTVKSLPIEIGTGRHKQVDTVRLHWTDLVANAGTVVADAKPLVIAELELPTGSCPNLYAWDGSGFRFITDFLGAAPLGLPLSDDRIIEADPEEIIHVGDDAAFPPRGDAFAITVTSELREVLYLDEARLLVVDHPPGTEIHSTSKLLPGKPKSGGFPAPRLLALEKRKPLVSAKRSDGTDVTNALAERDRRMVSPVALRPPQLRGLAEPWSVELDFSPLDSSRPLVLALTGWLRFGGGMANVAGSHDGELPFPFPQLEAMTAEGEWRKLDAPVGAPAGKTKTILVELTALPPGTVKLRLSTAFEIHWDRAAMFERSAIEPRVITLSPRTADLHWHGFGEFEPLPADQPLTPSHTRVRQEAPWRITPSGWCSRYGDASPLIAERDDAFAILNGGDELTLEFPTAPLPPKQPGWTRSLFFKCSGWDKDADYHVVHGWTVEPLPFHGMDDQRYGIEPRPARPGDALMREFNTRWVGPMMISNHR